MLKSMKMGGNKPKMMDLGAKIGEIDGKLMKLGLFGSFWSLILRSFLRVMVGN